ncbi:cuticle protein 16.5-like [Drosophila bipectinata]|uniref:cuticle protein 16.5-like n=1 Tax=Drosophila bipectinata TaxID=42026 RepID=UPI0038B2B479
MVSDKFKFSSRKLQNKATINMFKSAVVILAIVACAAAKPGLLGAPLAYTAPLAYSAPLAYTAPAAVVAAPAPVVTATSSQVIARNYNGIAAAPVVAQVAAPVIAKYATAPLATPVAAPLAAPLTYTSSLAYNAPLHYASAAVPVLI